MRQLGIERLQSLVNFLSRPMPSVDVSIGRVVLGLHFVAAVRPRRYVACEMLLDAPMRVADFVIGAGYNRASRYVAVHDDAIEYLADLFRSQVLLEPSN